MIGWNSIRGRLLWLSAAWLTAALLAAYLIIGGILRDFITDRFDTEASAVADSLIAGTRADQQGLAQLYDVPGDPRFSAPISGWYWQIEADGTAIVISDSLYDTTLPIANGGDVTGAAATGPGDAELRLLRRAYTVPGSDETLTATVTVPQAEIDTALAAVRRPLALTLIVLGVGLALAVLLQVTAGLSALKRMGQDLRKVHSGSANALPRPDAAELQPVADEINALILRNGEQLARTREQIGNLAHSLKTPLMALQGEMAADDPRQAMIQRMDRQIGWHLKRARSAAGGRRVLGQRTELAPVVEDISLVLRHTLQDAGITLEKQIPPGFSLPVEQQDAQEMLGNLMENASKWTRSRIMVRAGLDEGRITVTICDDGPGMADEDYARALSRGTRLDERGAGSGLGLAIVADLAALNGGTLKLGRDDDLGGLSARITLPAL
ncbi:sensor histidine kinase [Paracoccus aerodenitrificans]|uniref:sensor histidine kinase n=1 Tax=Paracoccus aerodenitrificans TaxID=3017781 RepID=UPI0022F02C8F|nr:HAMP domain-containing sensor histidine kinase [Paracoccus aerodenitrificans]WBU65228.1 HAMP domain-containing sensor histidine kinase [Paracoccus aerodenitrificans]